MSDYPDYSAIEADDNSLLTIMSDFTEWKNRLWAAIDAKEQARTEFNRIFTDYREGVSDPKVLIDADTHYMDTIDTVNGLERVVNAMRSYIDNEYGPFA